ncbi:hypothetical protein SAMN02745911_3165 [Aureimonas altamirensis DSM 21988]|uniref:Uncharacterized protein n=2 Tax=Aureimonas altamirensis TaxID=370622 RepID=A0ABY1IP49_9HYPH|nr:hypothetical protein SAMN02745911_3165 [Aureimonas altamirensis DSM 21988]
MDIATGDRAMTKIVSALMIVAMVVQVIRPLGLPGLRKRGDFWKIALAALFVFGATVLIRPQ